MAQHPDPIVQIAPGRVRGFWRAGSAAFLGVPFAQPPVGERRFGVPVPPEPWDGVRDAIEYGATAHRRVPGEVTLIPEPTVPGDSTLNVNVFTPRPGERDAALPVLVYIHGGGYTAGSPASPWYDGAAFNRDGVVAVSISYRLGFDGFGYIAGAPSNRGVRDWLAALEWVRDNITAFGGDPGRVTIAGQSAGGGAVLSLLGMPAAQGLFHAAWAMSAALADVSAERARTFSAKLANLAGVPPTRAGFASVAEEEIVALQRVAASSDSKDRLAGLRTLLDEGLSWGPMIDGDLIPRPTVESLRVGVGAEIPLVIGSTDDEFTMLTDGAKNVLRVIPAALALGRLDVAPATVKAYLAANGPQRRKGTAAVLGRYATDVIFRSLVPRVAEARADAATWVYRFEWPSPVKGWACHCLDVPFWFDCLDFDGVAALTGDHPPRALAAALHGSAAAFMRDGRPGWTPWSSVAGTTRAFGGEASRPDVVADGYASVRALV
ncbi:MAG TPA: carboxylesterase family protein [Microbacterium sp.]|nr:carboxylesterase family protein [Microbacterium sp.]